MQGIPYDGTAVSVRQEGQVGKTSICGDIGNVSHQKAAVCLGDILGISVEQVIIYTVRMVGVCSARTVTFSLEHQSVGTEDIKKSVTSDDELVTEELTAQMV